MSPALSSVAVTGSPTGCAGGRVLALPFLWHPLGHLPWQGHSRLAKSGCCVPNSTPRRLRRIGRYHLAPVFVFIYVALRVLVGQPLSAGSSPHPHLQVCMSFRSRSLVDLGPAGPRRAPRTSPTANWRPLRRMSAPSLDTRVSGSVTLAVSTTPAMGLQRRQSSSSPVRQRW